MRVCPSCGLKVNNDLSNFCYSCGEKLPEREINSTTGLNSIRSDININEKKSHKKINFSKLSDLKFFIIGVNALSVLFFVFALGIFFRFGYVNPYQGNKISPLVEINSISLGRADIFSSFSGFVLKSSLYELTPLEIYSYIESSNSNTFLKNFISDENKKYLQDTFELDFEDLLVFFKPTLAYVQKDNSTYAVILETSGFDFFERAYSKYQTNKKQTAKIYAKRVKEFLIFSNSENFLGDFEDVSNNLQISLSTDSTFKSAISESNSKSVFFVYSNNKNYYENDFNKDLELFELQIFEDEFEKFETTSFFISEFDNTYELNPIE